mgnify:CR=1 FL=1
MRGIAIPIPWRVHVLSLVKIILKMPEPWQRHIGHVAKDVITIVSGLSPKRRCPAKQPMIQQTGPSRCPACSCILPCSRHEPPPPTPRLTRHLSKESWAFPASQAHLPLSVSRRVMAVPNASCFPLLACPEGKRAVGATFRLGQGTASSPAGVQGNPWHHLADWLMPRVSRSQREKPQQPACLWMPDHLQPSAGNSFHPSPRELGSVMGDRGGVGWCADGQSAGQCGQVHHARRACAACGTASNEGSACLLAHCDPAGFDARPGYSSHASAHTPSRAERSALTEHNMSVQPGGLYRADRGNPLMCLTHSGWSGRRGRGAGRQRW